MLVLCLAAAVLLYVAPLVAIGVGAAAPGVVHAHDEGDSCTEQCVRTAYRK